jgi:hypothetical protein
MMLEPIIHVFGDLCRQQHNRLSSLSGLRQPRNYNIRCKGGWRLALLWQIPIYLNMLM